MLMYYFSYNPFSPVMERLVTDLTKLLNFATILS